MTLDEIVEAVDAGRTVCWSHDGYEVRRTSDKPGGLGMDVICLHNNHMIGLTWLDGVTVNGQPEDFYVKEET